MGNFKGVLSYRFPPLFTAWTQFFSTIFQLDAVQITAAGCFMETNFYVKLLFMTLGPLGMCIGVWLLARVAALALPNKREKIFEAKTSILLAIVYIVYASVSVCIFDTFNCKQVRVTAPAVNGEQS